MRTKICALLVVLAWGCSNTPPPHSCVVSGTTPLCVDFIAFSTQLAISAEQYERAVCDGFMGSYSTTSSCPTNGRVARCTITDTEGTDPATMVTQTYRISSYSPATTVGARASCPPSMPAANTTYSFEEN